MSATHRLVQELEATRRYFRATISVFEPGDATYAPAPSMYTVAGHVAHTADSVDWFVEGGFGNGWDMDFEALIARAKAVVALEEARAWLDRAFDHAIQVVGAASGQAIREPIPDDRIMKGAPRRAIVGGIVDHTAHHRGALAVYARLIGKEPPIPYA